MPYRGLAPVIQDLMGGQIQFAPIDTAGALPHVKGGKLKALALMSRHRSAAFPGVPTLAELGFKDIDRQTTFWSEIVRTSGVNLDM